MALTDATQIRTTDFQTDTTSYTAGQEPWNKNLDGYNIETLETESVTYQCDWEKWHGMYRKIPELRSTIDTEVKWIISKKIKLLNAAAKEAAKKIKGKGRETFREILSNILRTSKIGGDCYAWAPRDKAGRLINLKILDPGSIEIQADKFGIIKKYVQLSDKNMAARLGKKRTILETFKPDEIFHLSNESIADEIHGIPEPEKMQDIIKMNHQAMSSNAVVLYRYGKPTFFFEADTDEESELVAITDKINKAVKNFENVVVPKGALNEIKKASAAQFSTLDPMPWINFLRSYYTESSNVPELVRGRSDEVSLAAGKLNLVAYKERVEFQQIDYAEKIMLQLGLEIEFEKPIMIDVEISKTDEDMNLKEKAKMQKGGELVLDTKRTSDKK